MLIAADPEKHKEVQETLSLPKNTWGAIRFAEEFVGSKLSELTGAQVSIRTGTVYNRSVIIIFADQTSESIT